MNLMINLQSVVEMIISKGLHIIEIKNKTKQTYLFTFQLKAF